MIRNPELIEQEKVFFINIQEYYTFKNLKLKTFLIEKIGKYLTSGDVSIKEIRAILHHFRFVYRFIYKDLL